MMIKTPLVALVALLSLFGCATSENLVQPDLVFRSAKEAATVAACLAEQWKTFALPGGGTVPVSLGKMLGTYTLTASCNGGKNCKLAEVTSLLDHQSTTRMYPIAIGEGRYLDAVNYCQ